ncbi:MAG TPA: ATP-binding protein [Pyrinomonadaceae bacterium]|nr:ATP-binding protein [Pyrinomonadaceae bacterium]
MEFFNTFRGRLSLILALLLIATLALQFYLNLKTQNENEERHQVERQTLSDAFALGFSAFSSKEQYLSDLISQPGRLDDEARARIRDIIIIDDEWQIADSLNPDLAPTIHEDGTASYKKLSDATDLPPLMEASRLGPDVEKFPNRRTAVNDNSDDEAHAIPIDTTSNGRWYVMVLLKNDRKEAAWRAAQPLVYTLGIVLVSTLITLLFAWRFTRPIANLSNAARSVAMGDLSIRVPYSGRTDEMGQLAQNFNEMTAELEKTRLLEEKLREAEKSAVVGRLGSAIAHEIRNPLNYINLTLDHLNTKFDPDDERSAEYHKLIGQIKTEVARINQQISDFLNYSRPAKANLQPVEAREVIEDSLRLVEAQAAESNIKIGVVEREDVPKIMGDSDFLRSVFNNLFINALQAIGSEGGKMNVKISPDNGFVRFDVTDTGMGIPQENLPKVFEPYFSTKETGTGLGLAIVQKIVDIHHGSIDVESIEGEGTKFTVRLPRA